MSRLVPSYVWVYLVRGAIKLPNDAPPDEPDNRVFARDFEEKGIPVILDNPCGEGLSGALQDTVIANYRGNPLTIHETPTVSRVTDVKLIGKTFRPGDLVTTPKAFPRETR